MPIDTGADSLSCYKYYLQVLNLAEIYFFLICSGSDGKESACNAGDLG